MTDNIILSVNFTLCTLKIGLVVQSYLTLCYPMDCSPPGYSVQGFSRQECWSGLPFPSPGHLPEPGIKPGSPALQADSLPSEPPEKPVLWKKGKSESASHSVMSDCLRPHALYSPWNSPGQNIGVDCHSLLHRIFLTQRSNLGLLHCRQILYHLSHQGSPMISAW